MVPLRKYSRAQVSRAVRLVSEGSSFAKAAKAVGMTAPAVRNHCLAAGVRSSRSRTNGHAAAFAPGARPFSPFEDAFIVQAKAFGQTVSAIGKQIDRRPGSVSSRLLTLKLRQLSEDGEV